MRPVADDEGEPPPDDAEGQGLRALQQAAQQHGSDVERDRRLEGREVGLRHLVQDRALHVRCEEACRVVGRQQNQGGG